MKTRYIIFLLWFAAAGVLGHGCGMLDDMKDLDDTEKIAELTVTVKAVNTTAGTAAEIPLPDEMLVRLIDDRQMIAMRHTTTSATSDISGVIPGLYTVKISGTTFVGDKRYFFNGTVANTPLTKETPIEIEVDMTPGLSGDFIFKELYYCASWTPAGANYSYDQFYEIYNNTDEVMYADGLCVAYAVPNIPQSNPYTWVDADNNVITEPYVYVTQVWTIPGGGTDYPVKPGESFLVVGFSYDNTEENRNPASIDLSMAEFEAVSPPYYNTSQDGPALNMLVVVGSTTSSMWMPAVYGPGMILFRNNGEVSEDNSAYIQGYSNKYYIVPPSIVIDGVDCMRDESSANWKRLPTTIDAGSTWVGGLRVNKSVSRKVDDIVDGRYIFQDTNDSSDDFEIMEDGPVVRRYGTGVPSWNTWIRE